MIRIPLAKPFDAVYGVIYIITNTVNGKSYVGQTVDLKTRWQGHKQDAKTWNNRHLCQAMRKYGFDKFKVEVLCECPNIESLNEAEAFFIKMFATWKRSFGYNMTMGGEGYKPTKEANYANSVRQKIAQNRAEVREIKSKAAKEQWASLEARVKQSERLLITHNTPEYKLAAANRAANYLSDPVNLANMINKVTVTCSTPEFRQASSERMAVYYSDPLNKARQDEILKKARASRKTKLSRIYPELAGAGPRVVLPEER